MNIKDLNNYDDINEEKTSNQKKKIMTIGIDYIDPVVTLTSNANYLESKKREISEYSQLYRLDGRLGTKLRCSDVTLLVTLQEAVATFVALLAHAEGDRLHADLTD